MARGLEDSDFDDIEDGDVGKGIVAPRSSLRSRTASPPGRGSAASARRKRGAGDVESGDEIAGGGMSSRRTGSTRACGGQGRGQGRSKGSGKGCKLGKNMREYQACFKFFPREEFTCGSTYRNVDKPAINNIHNAGKRAEEHWYAKQVNSHAKTKLLVAGDHKQCPEPRQGQKRKVFNITKYVEMTKTQLLDDQGEMISKIAYIAHTGKPKYGAMDAVSAGVEWDELAKSAAELVDFDGANPEYRTLFCTTPLIFPRDLNLVPVSSLKRCFIFLCFSHSLPKKKFFLP